MKGGDAPKRFLGLDEYDWQTVATKALTSIPYVFAAIICAKLLS